MLGRMPGPDVDPVTAEVIRWRGLPGARYGKRLTAPASVFTYQVGMKYPMPGLRVERRRGPEAGVPR